MGRQSRLKQERRQERARAVADALATSAARRDAAARGAEEGKRRGCLFCRERDVSFSSVEHVFPESLGNKELVLPVGVVCDSCNNQKLSVLDDALLHFGAIPMLRTIYGIESKSGNRPSFKFDNGSLISDRPGNVKLHLASERWWKDGLPAPPRPRELLVHD
jgi:hypothetical protein